MKLSISGKIILNTAASVIASSVLILCLSTILMGRLLTKTIQKEMSTMRSVIERMQKQDEAYLLHEMQLLTAMPEIADAVQRADVGKLREIAQVTLRRLDINAITFTNARGVALNREYAERTGDDLSILPAMAAALDGEIISGIFLNEEALAPYAIRCYAPIYKEGVLAGALTLGSDIATEKYVDNLQNISGMHFTFYKGDTVIMTSITDESGQRINGTKLTDTHITDTVLVNGRNMIVRGDLLGEPVMSAYWPVLSIDDQAIGMCAITISLNEHIKESDRVLIIVIFCSLGIMLLLAFTAGFLGRRITRPIRKVINYAVQVSGGNLDIPLNVKSNDEVGLLVGALHIMVNKLKERIREAETLTANAVLDTEEVKSIMQEMERQRAKADAANHAKSVFLSTMSHEIRTPMNAILGITEIQLHNDNLDPNVMEALEKIYISGDLLLCIINDILDLSRIEAGKLELNKGRYEIASMISDTAQLNMMRIGSKPIEFDVNVHENMPAYLTGDEIRIKQILNNLLSNAFKYTAEGCVKLSIIAEESGNADEVILVISVTDTGQGMTDEQINRLFDEYARFNEKENPSTEGTGLGMSITRNLINLMNGDISVKSEPGKGTAFIVRIPQIRRETCVVGREVADNLRQFRALSRAHMKRVQISREPMPYGSVLVVDDVEMNLFVAKGLLVPYELKIDTVDSGLAVIEKIKNGHVYDIIFMDHMMPKMDGVESVKIIRGMGYSAPIVALTANAVSGQAQIFLENGFDYFISKPIDVRQLNIVLNKFIRDKQPQDVIEAARQMAEIKKEYIAGSVILADDPRTIDIFTRDASKTISVLKNIINKNGIFDENDLQMYVIYTHGIKSALANIGRMDLCSVALKLEQSAKDKNIDFIKSETQEFLYSLQSCVDELFPGKKDSGIINQNDSAQYDMPFLREKLLVIKAACENYDEQKADKAIADLMNKKWPVPVNECLSVITGHLLHSDFDEIVQYITGYLDM
ncbi:MAG: response regulator [Treponema sp.]|jgi:signal transduction histidine kinase/CheY-like chemotaxis protein|nr:response regulator [Treponema sp.]